MIRKYITICLITLSIHAANIGYTEDIISNLKSFSKNQTKEILTHIQNPFMHHDAQTENLELYAIINGKALIGGKWLCIGDTIRGYKIVDIHIQHINLQKGKTNYDIMIGESIYNKRSKE